MQYPQGGYGLPPGQQPPPYYGGYPPQPPRPSGGGAGLWIAAAIALLLVFVGLFAGGAFLFAARRRSAAVTPPATVTFAPVRGGATATGTATTARPPTVTAPDTSVHVVPIGSSPTRGPATALVTIVEFSEFQCPYCQKVQPTLDRVRTDYGADVRFVWKNQPLPMHEHAEPAAELALEAKSQKGEPTFWAIHDAIFADQAHIDMSDLLALARRFGLNESAVSTAILTTKWASLIKADQSLATALGATGTPTFFINGRKLTGAQPYEKFKALIDSEIVAAKAELAKGTPRANLYDTLTARGSVP